MAAERADSSGEEQRPAASLLFWCGPLPRNPYPGSVLEKRAPWLVEEDIGKTQKWFYLGG